MSLGNESELDGVATVLTVYGIETLNELELALPCQLELQQSLPFTVLKLLLYDEQLPFFLRCNSPYRLRY